jgi:hypothetical protein
MVEIVSFVRYFFSLLEIFAIKHNQNITILRWVGGERVLQSEKNLFYYFELRQCHVECLCKLLARLAWFMYVLFC